MRWPRRARDSPEWLSARGDSLLHVSGSRRAAGAGARAGEEPARSILSNLYMPQVVVGMWPRRVASLCGLSVRVLHELSVRFRVLIISSPVQSYRRFHSTT